MSDMEATLGDEPQDPKDETPEEEPTPSDDAPGD